MITPNVFASIHLLKLIRYIYGKNDIQKTPSIYSLLKKQVSLAIISPLFLFLLRLSFHVLCVRISAAFWNCRSYVTVWWKLNEVILNFVWFDFDFFHLIVGTEMLPFYPHSMKYHLLAPSYSYAVCALFCAYRDSLLWAAH